MCQINILAFTEECALKKNQIGIQVDEHENILGAYCVDTGLKILYAVTK